MTRNTCRTWGLLFAGSCVAKGMQFCNLRTGASEELTRRAQVVLSPESTLSPSSRIQMAAIAHIDLCLRRGELREVTGTRRLAVCGTILKWLQDSQATHAFISDCV